MSGVAGLLVYHSEAFPSAYGSVKRGKLSLREESIFSSSMLYSSVTMW